MRAIRFLCPRCGMHHRSSVARAGQPFACSSCFAPMIIPETAVAPSAQVPTAESIEVPPPKSEALPPGPVIIEREAAPDEEVQPTPRRHREPASARPSPRFERPAPPEPDPAAIDPPPIEVVPTRRGSTEPATVPVGRILMALSAVVGLVAIVVVAGNSLNSREGKDPEAVVRPAGVAIVEKAPAQPPTTPTPATPRTPEPIPVAKVAPSPTPEVQLQPEQAKGLAIREAQAPKVEEATPRPEPAPPGPLVIRRRQMLGQEALRQQLAKLPEIKLSHGTEATLFARLGLQPIAHRPTHHPTHGVAGQAGFLGPVLNPPTAHPQLRQKGSGMHAAHPRDDSLGSIALIKQRQPELGQLPWRMGDDCHLDHETAEALEVQSRSLRNLLLTAIPPGDTRPDAELLRGELFFPATALGAVLGSFTTSRGGRRATARWDVPSSIPVMMQLLMAERTPVRLVLIDVLSQIKDPAASKALARLAIFDLAPEVRERALVALRDRPAGDYRPSFVEALRYPWAPVADHAAEALVSLEDREAIPQLVALLDEPDPQLPRTEIHEGKSVDYTRSLVQVNHLRNCLLCHAPSTNTKTDLVRARVPTEGLPLPPPNQYYASQSPGEFVRAEVTYLRQDFSVTQPVERPGPWPAFQRYDYVVSERPLASHRPLEPKQNETEKATYPQRESVLFALRELTGKDLGNESAAWKAEVRAKVPAE